MTYPGSVSTVAAAVPALFDLLEAVAPDALAQHPTKPRRKVLISFGLPGHEDMETVAILGLRTPKIDVETLGAMRREEEYDIELGVKVHDPTATDDAAGRKALFLRALFVAAWVDSVVIGHYTLNSTVRTAFVTEQITSGVQAADRAGLVMFVLLVVHVEADIVGTTAAP